MSLSPKEGMRMKKWTALILFGVLLTSAGCGNAPADSAVQETKATTETTEEVVYTDPYCRLSQKTARRYTIPAAAGSPGQLGIPAGNH